MYGAETRDGSAFPLEHFEQQSNKDISHSGMLEPQLCKLHQLDTLLSEKPKCHDKFLMVQAYCGHFLFAASSVIGFA
jgi:hypothetical protein